MREENKYLFDTSAWFTLLEDEEGANQVERLLKNEKIVVPFIVLLEIYYITLQEKGTETADKRYAMIKSLDLEILWKIDEPTLMLASYFKAKYRISLADAIIAAFAKKENAILVHKDPEYEILKHKVKQLILPYKKKLLRKTSSAPKD
ncbi:tRNA(fMet)-specific endonuclease VapC [Candidatus Methanoperedenaceae archaeon GB37]|nr:tRNA(fMet)-specific endonuclease VapC [Candidatus Methanoperedenaceae archaeon GB37]